MLVLISHEPNLCEYWGKSMSFENKETKTLQKKKNATDFYKQIDKYSGSVGSDINDVIRYQTHWNCLLSRSSMHSMDPLSPNFCALSLFSSQLHLLTSNNIKFWVLGMAPNLFWHATRFELCTPATNRQIVVWVFV